MLRNYGFDNAAVLNGGFQKWAREGRPVETGPAKPRPPAKFTVREDRKLMVGKEAVRGAIGDAAVCTINALAAQQHTGTGGNVYGRVGRIAKSVNVPAASLLNPETGAFLPPAALRAKFDAVGAFDKKQVITYCGGGIAASADALILVMLGHPDVKLYDASMSEWANDDACRWKPARDARPRESGPARAGTLDRSSRSTNRSRSPSPSERRSEGERHAEFPPFRRSRHALRGR